ncbi:MAG: hypothetical protein A2W25_12195 [candidate division Zixibacteria bacterium RBG_16_53_22]|nr:MAG: hypothetical protein A2W25_12195 [candidate division Zixibacteria bacterium RBG_16_53_22]
MAYTEQQVKDALNKANLSEDSFKKACRFMGIRDTDTKSLARLAEEAWGSGAVGAAQSILSSQPRRNWF